MKVTINGFVYYRKYRFEDHPTYVFHRQNTWDDLDHVLIGPHSFEVEIPDNFDPTQGKIARLREEKQRIQAEAYVKAENIERQIQELLCIENKAEVCPMCKSFYWRTCNGVVAGVETYYKFCDDCHHQWGYE